MIRIPGYELIEVVAEKSEVCVYRANYTPENRSVIVKSSLEGAATPRNLARIAHEYEVTRELKSDGVIKPIGLERHSEGVALVFEDYHGRPLSELIDAGELNLDLFLRVAINLAGTLGEIHAQHLIHKDIKPENIVIDGEGTARIIDFGISERINLKNRHLGNPDVLEGTLAYISPEQTGRMNRVLDYRSDLYSLGVTFYQMLTGRLPFETRDSMELVYSHIAHRPASVTDRNPEIPAVLSEIVDRLLAKNAEDRYQSAFGLKHDLEECLRRLEEGAIESFETGRRDFSGQFQIPEKLYGRDDQLAILLQAFDRIATGANELMLVGGYSGVGKSALVYEIHKPVTAKRSYFISGKYDQFQKNIPYYAIHQAFNEFVQLLLTEPAAQLDIWKNKILQAVGDNGQVLIDIVPALKLIIGEQPEVPVLGPQEAQTRFNLVCSSFVRAISREEHPLVLFVDDLQWADSASLALLRNLMSDAQNKYFLLIGAYRDNEVSPSHPFMVLLEEVRELGAVINEITLLNLSLEDTGHLLADALYSEEDAVQELTDLVYTKTQGNAFFTTEFLKELYENRLLQFDFSRNGWFWDVSAIVGLNITDNVVDLMTRKLGRLDATTREVLNLASCIGNKFFLNVLAIIHEKSLEESLEHLWPTITESLVVPLNDNYKLISRRKEAGAANAVDHERTRVGFRFGHDRIQQAAYNLEDETRLKEIHLKIARLLDSHTSAEELDGRVFDIVNQYALALDLVDDPDEMIRVMELYLRACEKAFKSSAFESVLEYLGGLLPCLSPEHWDSHQELMWKLYHRKAHAEHAVARFEDCDATLREALARSKTQDQHVVLYQIHLENLFSMNRHEEGVQVMRDALKYLGVRMPRKVTKAHIAVLYARVRRKLRGKPAADLLKLPEIQDRRQYNISAILCDSVPSTYFVHPDTMGYIGLMMADICIEYGNSRYSAFSYSIFAIIIASLTKEYARALEIGMVSFDIAERYPDTEMKTRANFLVGNFNVHWMRPMAEHLPMIRDAVRFGAEVGSLNWVNYAIIFSRPQSLLFQPATLREIETENYDYLDLLIKNNDIEAIQNQQLLLHFTGTLRGEIDPRLDGFDAQQYAAGLKKDSSFIVLGYFHSFRMVQAYLLEEPEAALSHAWESMKMIHEVFSNLVEFVQRFYFALVYLRWKDRLKGADRIKFRLAYRLQRFLVKHAATSNPINFQAHYDLLRAEEARVEGRIDRAAALYDSAIAEAEKAGFPQNLALCTELAGRAYLEWGGLRAAEPLLRKAHGRYHRWGAAGVTARMQNQYADLFDLAEETGGFNRTHRDPRRDSSSSSSTTTELLDIESVLKASRTISGDIKIENLLRNMMRIVRENAGAENALLLLAEDGRLILQASADAQGEIETLQGRHALESFAPLSILEYVRRTNEAVVLPDATDQEQFTRSDYIKTKRPRSVLAAPIQRQGSLVGVLYLENNLVTGAFTPDRLQVLNLLSSQLAVSLENALLYANLEEKVQVRTRELNASKKETDDIMANVRQGILTLDRSGRIGPEYSLKAAEIFERDDLAGLPFSNLFKKSGMQAKIDNYIDELFDNTYMSEQMFAMANPLREESHELPSGRQKMLSILFSRILGEDGAGTVQKVMVVVEDRSAEYELQRQLQARAEEQARRVEKLYQILNLEPRIFTQFIREASETLSEIRPRLEMLSGEAGNDQRILEECFRAVHTLKGNARALNLESIAARAHGLEDELDVLRANTEDLSAEFVERALQAVQDFSTEIQDGNSIFEKILNMKNALQDQEEDPLRDLENTIRRVIRAEGEATGKSVDLIFRSNVPGDEPGLNGLLSLRNAFIQLIRNSIDHGIEPTEERMIAGKPARGQIRVELNREEDGQLSIYCEDDGRGLDLETIKTRVLERGLRTQEDLERMDAGRIYRLIFISGLSTSDRITETSGRGVGMDIVREEVKRARARLSIRSQAGRSTRFTIRMPGNDG